MSRATQEAPAIPPEVLERYEAVIGLEVHVQLKTRSKIFCGCSTRFGDPPNTNVCPVCLGLPGSLPVLNRRAVELAVRAALALGGTIRERSRFARKNYFYPDLPKGYQISMYELPLAVGGAMELEPRSFGAAPPFDAVHPEVDRSARGAPFDRAQGRQGKLRVGITRLHLEEDAAKALHEGFPDSEEKTYIDYNRCGVPLIEIVSEADLRSPGEAHACLTALKQILEYTEVSDCNMEEGSLRCDANVSVRRRGAEALGTKTEVKNLNSFRYLERALAYEIERQIGVLEGGGRVEQETRLWDLTTGRTEPMRSKEYAHDYRYFPEPDLLPVVVPEGWKREILAVMPELPAAKRARFLRDYQITPYDAGLLTATRALADYFEAVVKAGAPAKSAANWIQTELLRRLNDAGLQIGDSQVSPQALAELIALVEAGEITAASGKKVFAKMFETGKPAGEIVAREGIGQISDAAEIERVCREVIASHPENAASYKAGNPGVFKFFVGQVMRATRGQANPQLVHDTLRRLLG